MTTDPQMSPTMHPRESRLFRHLLAGAVVLASLALSGCGGNISLPSSNTDRSPNFNFGSGWGGNRDWGNGNFGGH